MVYSRVSAGGDGAPSKSQATGRDGILADRFRRAEAVLPSVPMGNFGIPYRLKHLIDVASRKDVLFTFDENGLRGGRRAVVVNFREVPPPA